MDTTYNIIERTNLIIPYTLQDSKNSMSMRFVCDYIEKQNVKLEYIYTCTIDEKNTYRGIEENLYTKDSPITYQKSQTSTGSTVNLRNYIRLYFPIESLSVYLNGSTKYYVNIYLYIKDVKHYLFSNIIDSYNNLACPQFIDGGVRYQEYQDIPIMNAREYTKTYKDNDNSEYLMFIGIQPVSLCNNIYTATQNTSGGSSFINYNPGNDLSVRLSIIPESRIIRSYFSYDKNLGDSVNNYIKNIYGDNITLKMLYYLIDNRDENIYTWDESEIENITNDIYDKKYDELHKAEDEQTLWIWNQDAWKEGMQLRASLKISNQEDDFGSGRVLTVHSQPIFITKSNLKDFLPNNNVKIEIPDDMIKNIRVENKIESKNIIVSQSSSNSGAIKPVFFKAYDLSEIVIHRDMVQNIAIDLDDYESKVETFYLKLCGNYFIEYARTIDGIIFCIDGTCITSNTGTYYICDADKTYITSGKYSCE